MPRGSRHPTRSQGSAFATTQWSLVLAAHEGSDTEARRALEWLCTTYWYPIYAYIRGRVRDAEEARDLTQGYFADLLERNLLSVIDRSKGRFRDFLLASLKNFLSHQRDRAQALKRGGGSRTVSIDATDAESRFRLEPVDRLTPEQLFERRWGLAVMERAMERLRAESAAGDRPATFERLKPYLTGAEPRRAYGEVAAELQMSEGAVKTAVHRLRQRYGSLLRGEIAATVADPAEVDARLLVSYEAEAEGEPRAEARA